MTTMRQRMTAQKVSGLGRKGLVYGAVALGLAMGSQTLQAQYRQAPYGQEARSGPVEQTIEHLERVAQSNGVYSKRERARYDNALRHLGEFQARLQRRNFDKDKLDQAIEDVQNVVDHNPMDRRAKEVLWHDLGALRSLRARYDHGYGRY